MPTAAEEIKSQYASNRKQIGRDYKKIERLELSVKHCTKISDREQLQDEIAVLHRGITDMNKQNNQALERVKRWWRD